MSYSLLEKSCPFCTFEAPKVAILLSHLRTVHANDPRFSVTAVVEEPQNLSLRYILMCIDITKAISERETLKMKNCHPQSLTCGDKN